MKSDSKLLSQPFNIAFVKFLPFPKENTGLSQLKVPLSVVSSLSFSDDSAGHYLSLIKGKTSTAFPLKPVVLLYGTIITISFSPKNLTCFHSSEVSGSKFFTELVRSSAILQEVKKLTVQAVQKACFDRFDQSSSAILWLRISSNGRFIGNLFVLLFSSKSQLLLAPVNSNFMQGSELRLTFFILPRM